MSATKTTRECIEELKEQIELIWKHLKDTRAVADDYVTMCTGLAELEQRVEDIEVQMAPGPIPAKDTPSPNTKRKHAQVAGTPAYSPTSPALTPGTTPSPLSLKKLIGSKDLSPLTPSELAKDPVLQGPMDTPAGFNTGLTPAENLAKRAKTDDAPPSPPQPVRTMEATATLAFPESLEDEDKLTEVMNVLHGPEEKPKEL